MIVAGCDVGRIVKRLEDMLETKIMKMPEDPQIIGALGAAVMAEETAR
ncbi:MAG: hypothetical protein JRS35_17355 [Deltaproteobacteria bacterium]|nr:hypothetical protein [Deltaproteobacteria bacterium]